MNSLGKWIRLPLLGLLTVTALGGAGCADYGTGLVILGNVPPDLESCSVEASTSVYRSDGTLELNPIASGASYGFNLTPVMRNETADRLIYLKGAEIEIRSTGTEASDAAIAALEAEDLVETTQLTSGSVDGGGLIANIFPVVDRNQARVLQGALSGYFATEDVQIVARTQVRYSLSGYEEETEPFDFPVWLCGDCVDIPDEATCELFVHQQ